MTIRVHSRLILARYKGCTNARCRLSRSYGHEEFKNANPFSVQKAHKAVRTGQYLRPLHRSIAPPIEIRVHSRIILARYNGCTNAMCRLSRSYGHEEFKNANPFSVQMAHKAVRIGQYLRSLHRRIVPKHQSQSQHANWTLIELLQFFICYLVSMFFLLSFLPICTEYIYIYIQHIRKKKKKMEIRVQSRLILARYKG